MKILYVVARSTYSEVEQKVFHYLTALGKKANLSVIFLVDNPLQQQLEQYNIECRKVKGYTGLTNYLQFDKYDLVHFYGPKRLHSVIEKSAKNVPIVESIFNKQISDTQSLNRNNLYTIFDNQNLYKEWNSPSNSIVVPFSLNGELNKQSSNSFTKFQLGLTGKTIIGVICNSAENLNLSLLLQLNQSLENHRDKATIVIACTPSLSGNLKKKTNAARNIIVKDYNENLTQCFDVYLGFEKNTIEINVLEMLNNNVPIVIPESEYNKQFLQSIGKVGFLYQPTGAIELLRQYCFSSSKIDLKVIKIPSEYYIQSNLDRIIQFYQNALKNKPQKTIDLTPEIKNKTLDSSNPFQSDQMTYYIIPYAIYGGAEIYLKNHLEALKDKSNVMLLFVSQGNPLETEMRGKVKMAVLGNLARLGNYILTNKITNVCFYNSRAVYQLLSRLKKLQPLHVTEIVHSYHSWKDSMHGTSRGYVDKVITVSGAVAKQWKISKFEVVPPVIDVKKFKNTPKNKSTKYFTIGTVARISPEKDLFKVVDIATKFDSNYRFVIVGKDGGAKKALLNYIKQKGMQNRVIVKDHTANIEKEYATFDLFLLTSKVEGTPLTILEAQAAGLPVVAPDVGAIREMMAGHKGYVYTQNHNFAKIASRMKELIGSRRKATTKPKNSNRRDKIAKKQNKKQDKRNDKITRSLIPTQSFLPKIYPLEEKATTSFYIFITTYNRPNQLLTLLKDIEREKSNYTIEVHIYDDHSSADYSAVKSFTNERDWIKYHRMPRNHGKENFWKLTTRMYKDTQKTNFTYYLSLQDDNRLCSSFFYHCDFMWKKIEDPNKVAINLVYDKVKEKNGRWGTKPTTTKQFGSFFIDQVGFTDCMFMCIKESLTKLQFQIGSPSSRTWKRNPHYSSGVGKYISHKFDSLNLNIYRPRESLLYFQKVETVMQNFSVKDLPTLDNYEPLVSVYIPAYNCGNFLEKAINSVLNQTYKNIEVQICNDGSTDNTKQILEKYNSDSRVNVINQVNSGIAAASETAIKECSGQIIAQLDSDDWLDETAIEKIVKVYNDNPGIGGVYTNYRLVDENGKDLGSGPYLKGYNQDNMLLRNIVHPLRTFHKTVYQSTLGFDKDLNNAVDYDIQMKLTEISDFYHLEEELYYYRQRSNGITKSKNVDQANNSRKIIERALERRKLPYRVEQAFPGSFAMKIVKKDNA